VCEKESVRECERDLERESVRERESERVRERERESYATSTSILFGNFHRVTKG
jgi:hypothetical protein